MDDVWVEDAGGKYRALPEDAYAVCSSTIHGGLALAVAAKREQGRHLIFLCSECLLTLHSRRIEGGKVYERVSADSRRGQIATAPDWQI